MINKKGLSNIVATVLIVLLALAAVAIVWGFLKPAFVNTGVEVGLQSQCISVEVEPVLCTYDATTVTVRARNMAGSAVDIIAVVDDAGGSTYFSMTEDAGELLGTVTFTDTAGGLAVDDLGEVTVAGVVSDGTNTETCSGATMACTWVGGP